MRLRVIFSLVQVGCYMDILVFNQELVESAKERMNGEISSLDDIRTGLLYEFSDRLTLAEEFSDIIPCSFSGVGSRGRKLRIDGYQLDDADSSLRLIVCDFSVAREPEIMTRTRAEVAFKQVQTFVEESFSNKIWSESGMGRSDASELASLIVSARQNTSRFRIYLFTDSIMSDRIKELPEGEINGIPVEFQIWDISRLHAVTTSTLGLEEFEIDLTEYVPNGLSCLPASVTDEYQGFLAVIPGDVLAKLYDKYGSKLLESNVRSYLTAKGSVNKNIQGTIRAEPEKFFVYNNGITCTATHASVEKGDKGYRIHSLKYLQIVNGGQTTASLHTAMMLGKADLSSIHIQMKLSVVTVEDTKKLEDMIENIARYSNMQNKVSDADFFSNHPYQQSLERHSRRVLAPSVQGAQYNTYWFYERARGQYQNAQLHLTPAKKREFQRYNPRFQMFVKTDVAKCENSWLCKPHIVSRGAQKNFSDFANYITARWGEDGRQFNNEGYFREIVARVILFRNIEKIVSSASWYQAGLPRAQIVTYTMSKLSYTIQENQKASTLDFKAIWNAQGLLPELEAFIQDIARTIFPIIITPPVTGMHVGEWSKKEKCWELVKELEIKIPSKLNLALISKEEAKSAEAENVVEGIENIKIDALTTVITLGTNYWKRLVVWAEEHSPIFGKEADLARLASRKGWIPSDRQAVVLMALKDRLMKEGFR